MSQFAVLVMFCLIEQPMKVLHVLLLPDISNVIVGQIRVVLPQKTSNCYKSMKLSGPLENHIRLIFRYGPHWNSEWQPFGKLIPDNSEDTLEMWHIGHIMLPLVTLCDLNEIAC